MLADIGGTWTEIRWELQVFSLKVKELMSPLYWIELAACVGISHRGVSNSTLPTHEHITCFMAAQSSSLILGVSEPPIAKETACPTLGVATVKMADTSGHKDLEKHQHIFLAMAYPKTLTRISNLIILCRNGHFTLYYSFLFAARGEGQYSGTMPSHSSSPTRCAYCRSHSSSRSPSGSPGNLLLVDTTVYWIARTSPLHPGP